MQFTYDPDKDATNMVKHGLSLADAQLVFNAPDKLTLQSPQNYLRKSKVKTIQSQHLNLNMTLLDVLKHKCEQVFLLMWMQLLIWWIISEQKKQNFKHT